MEPLEPIHTTSWITFGIIIIFAIIALFWLAWVIGTRTAKRAKEHDKFHDELADDINNFPVISANYDYLMNQLQLLGAMKYKNKEKTCVLSAIFWRKYTHIRLKRLEANNFK